MHPKNVIIHNKTIADYREKIEKGLQSPTFFGSPMPFEVNVVTVTDDFIEFSILILNHAQNVLGWVSGEAKQEANNLQISMNSYINQKYVMLFLGIVLSIFTYRWIMWSEVILPLKIIVFIAPGIASGAYIFATSYYLNHIIKQIQTC